MGETTRKPDWDRWDEKVQAEAIPTVQGGGGQGAPGFEE